jgi:hypothetical protein
MILARMNLGCKNAVEGLNRTGKRFLKSSGTAGRTPTWDPTKDKIAVIHKDAITAVAEMIESVKTTGRKKQEEGIRKKEQRRGAGEEQGRAGRGGKEEQEEK